MTDPRDRYNGSIDDMAKAFKPVAAKEPDGKKLFVYPNRGNSEIVGVEQSESESRSQMASSGESTSGEFGLQEEGGKGSLQIYV